MSLFGVYYSLQNRNGNETVSICETNPTLETKELVIDKVTLTAEVAASQSEKYKGLSGRTCIDEDRAMLFDYDSPGNYCFVMRDMNFPIDMVWLDEGRKVITIKDNAIPENYPAESYCPDGQAKYIVEVAAGLANKLGWSAGKQFEF